ncbi:MULTISPECIES: hypothetical protein [unclassified Lacrimispora]|uniref:hypothetical protein n=1 Tax=unclassified Lacrimispora TaxID=2719232 RepID=UPI0037706FD8
MKNQLRTYFSIGANTTRRLTKREIIDAINKNFPNDDDCIAIATNTEVRQEDAIIKNQSITFGKIIDLD